MGSVCNSYSSRNWLACSDKAKYNSAESEQHWWKRWDASVMMWCKTNGSTNMSVSWVMVMFRAIEQSLHESIQCCGIEVIIITQAICNVYVISSKSGATWGKLLMLHFQSVSGRAHFRSKHNAYSSVIILKSIILSGEDFSLSDYKYVILTDNSCLQCRTSHVRISNRPPRWLIITAATEKHRCSSLCLFNSNHRKLMWSMR